jgi:hypothetical protein
VPNAESVSPNAELETLRIFVRKVADYSNDAWLAREAAALVGSDMPAAFFNAFPLEDD